jgi:predicted 3-demethylubiquinone-9 3-methyltransferase (glyoxalase superfamily)
VLMPPGDYGFSKKFTWVSDRYGVSWQLNLGPVDFAGPHSTKR